MNKEAPYRKRAEQARKKINPTKEPMTQDGLPPRTEVHKKKQHKNKWKIKFPIIRLLVLFFILLPISIYSAYSYLNSLNNGGMNEKAVITSGGYEKISLQQQEDKKDNDHTEGSMVIEENHIADEDHSTKPTTSSKDDFDKQGGKGAVQLEGSIHNNEIEEESSANLSHKDQATQTKSIKEAEILYHTVKKGDNLFRISLKYYQSQEGMEILREANNLSGDEIQLGQVLVIPINNE